MKMSKQEMESEEYESLLLNRVRLLHLSNPEGIVDRIISSRTPAEVRQLLVSDDKITSLIVEVAQQFTQLPPQQPPKERHGLRPFPQFRPQFHPVDSFQGIQAPFCWSYSWPQFHPRGISHEFQAPFHFPQLQPQFHSGGISHEFQAPFPLPHSQPQFCHNGISHEFQAPLPLNVQIEPLHFVKKMNHCTLGCLSYIQTGVFMEFMLHSPPIGHTGSFQSTSAEFTGSGELMLEKEIRELLFLFRPPSLPIESLANMYMDRYGKPLRIEEFITEAQQHGKCGCSLTDLLMRLNTTRVIERKEQKYIVPAEDAPMYLARGFKLVMSSGSSNPNTIYVTFLLGSKFTEDDVRSYFSQYGTVTDVRIPAQGGRRYGFVSFQDPGTAKQILSKSTSHFICGDQVRVREYKFKHELERKPHYIIPMEYAPKHSAHCSKLAVPSARNDPNQIYVVFMPESKITEDDVLNYFSHYGVVDNVRIPLQGRHMYGFVSFQDPGTAERILSERNPHFICGDQVCVRAYKEKSELQKLAREGAHSFPGPQEVSDVSIVHECHTGEQLSNDHELFQNKLNKGCDQGIVTEKSSTDVAPVMVSLPTHNLFVHLVSEASLSQDVNTTESSYVPNRLDEASGDQDRDDLSLPETLDDVY